MKFRSERNGVLPEISACELGPVIACSAALLLFFFSMTLVPARLAHAADAETTGDLAVIGESAITVHAFKKEMGRYGGRISTEEHMQALLENMVRFEVLYAAAVMEGYDQDPEIVESLRKMIANKLRQDHLEPEMAKLTVSDEEIRSYYERHPEDFTDEGMIRAAVIQISIPKRASTEYRERMAKRAAEARAEAMKLDKATSSFGSVAVKYSDDQSTRYRGGNTGWLKKGNENYRWDKEVMDAIFSLKTEGEVGPVVETESGYYLVKLMEVKEKRLQSLEEVRAQVGHMVMREKRNDVEERFYAELMKKVPVSVNTELLKTMELPPGAERPGPPPLPAR